VVAESPGRALVAAAVLSVLAAGLGLSPHKLLADDGTTVTTRAEVVGPFGVTIDIKPGSFPNSINLACQGDIPVAILTTGGFDAATVDPGTVIFAGATLLHSALEDVDGDGDDDLILQFGCQDVSIPTGATQACLQGTTYQRAGIEGCDSVRIVSLGGPAGGAAAMPTARLAVAGAVLAPTPIGTPTATARSEPALPPATGAEGGLGTDGWPWLALLAGGSFALTVVAGLAWLLRPRRP